MTEYEFNSEHEKVFESFSYRIVGVSAVVLLGVGTSILQFLQALDSSNIAMAFLYFLLIFAHIAMAIFFFKPYDNFQRIIDTEGDDINQLMIALSEMNFAFLIFLVFDTLLIMITVLSEAVI